MKILVCVKQVPDTSGKVAVNPDGTLNRASMQTIINPDDMNAVEAAVFDDHVQHVRLELVGGLVHIAAPESGQVAVRHMRPDHYLPRRRV